jgi:hypothetical protein
VRHGVVAPSIGHLSETDKISDDHEALERHGTLEVRFILPVTMHSFRVLPPAMEVVMAQCGASAARFARRSRHMDSVTPGLGMRESIFSLGILDSAMPQYLPGKFIRDKMACDEV